MNCKHCGKELLDSNALICSSCGRYVGKPVVSDIQPIVDNVNHPSHYTAHPSGVECITITEHMNFCLGNAIKYIWRADKKNGLEDLRKAIWCLEREIQRRNTQVK